MTSELETLKRFLIQTPFFGGLEGPPLDLLVAGLQHRDCAAGETVFGQNDTGRSMYVIEAGEVLLSRRGESGSEIHLVRLGPGNFFGENTLIEMQPRPWTARASVATRLLELNGAVLYRLYREDLKAYALVLQNINRELCRKLRRADLRLTELVDENGHDGTVIRRLPQGV